VSRHHSARTRAPRTSAVTVSDVSRCIINVIEQLEHRRLLSAASPAQHHLGTGPGLAQPIAKYFDPKTHGPRATPLGNPTPFGLSPTQVRHAYGIDTITFSSGTITGDGSGQTVAIVDAFDDPKFVSSGTAGYNTSDLFFFNQQYGLPQFGGAGNPTFTKLNQSGGTTYPAVNNSWAGEIALDVEWVHAIAPKANIVLIEANDSTFGNLVTNSIATARTIAGVTAITMSFGGGEFAGETSFDSSFVTPGGHANITYLAASGDTGAPGSYPAYSPNVVAVGGTNLTLTAQNAWSSEAGWSGSGGGISTQESKPAYQSTVTQSATFRTNPDIAILGGPNSAVSVYDTQNNLS
jgi:subtilase family serine protease